MSEKPFRLLRRQLHANLKPALACLIALSVSVMATDGAYSKKKDKSDAASANPADPSVNPAAASVNPADPSANPAVGAEGKLLYGSASHEGDTTLQGAAGATGGGTPLPGSSWASHNPLLPGSAWESAGPKLRGGANSSILKGSTNSSFFKGSANSDFLQGSANSNSPFPLSADKRFNKKFQPLRGTSDKYVAKEKKVLYKGFLAMNCLEFNELGANYLTAERNYRGAGIKYGVSSRAGGSMSADTTVNFGGRDHVVQLALPGFRGGQVFLYTNDQHLLAIDPRTYDTWLWQPSSNMSDAGALWKKLTHRKPAR